MKITDIRAIYPNYRQPLGGWRPYLWQIVVRVETDAGVSGYGYGGGGVAAVEVVNRHMRELLLDETCDSPADIERLWDKLYAASIPYGRGGIAIMALSGIDIALWDLLGMAERQPVYALLGGASAPSIRAYASGDDPEWFAESGFT
ncbi:MAG: mandelate racemase/muconate lactonizing enzyme family protein, partial [Caldilineaceae bacterium]|nr:mandelate racemase/muconate lactonizing enzyme family protein [Caldilineaceae bacterium]